MASTVERAWAQETLAQRKRWQGEVYWASNFASSDWKRREKQTSFVQPDGLPPDLRVRAHAHVSAHDAHPVFLHSLPLTRVLFLPHVVK